MIARRCLDCGLVHLCPLPISQCACPACGAEKVETF